MFIFGLATGMLVMLFVCGYIMDRDYIEKKDIALMSKSRLDLLHNQCKNEYREGL